LTEQLIEEAQAATRRGDFAAAEALLRQALEKTPHDARALNALGMAALGRRDFSAARDHFARAAAADPAAPSLWMNKATAERELGDVEGERASLLAALAIDQRHLMANIRLAELHSRLGETAAATPRWSAVLMLCAQVPDPPPQIAQIMERAQSFMADASRRLEDALEKRVGATLAVSDPLSRRRFDTCVDAVLGRRRIYVNECSGLHYPFLPADEFFDRAFFPWLPEIEAQTDVIRAECEALLREGLESFDPYVAMEAGTPDSKWTPLDHNRDWSAFHLWRHGERIEEACARCPRTAEIIGALPLADMPHRTPTVFFSVLRPHTRLPAHTGVSNARAIIHLPLIVPPGCGFRVGGTTREWRVGEAFAFDDTIDHEAWNDSDQLRAVLIFDTWNPHLTEAERDLLRGLFHAVRDSGQDPGLAGAVAD
jgi:aspartate beta-hydroxylase